MKTDDYSQERVFLTMSFIKTEAREMRSDCLRNSAEKEILLDLSRLFVTELREGRGTHTESSIDER